MAMAAPTPSTSDVISAVPKIFCFHLPVCVFGGVVVVVAAVTAVVAVVVMAVAVVAVVVGVVALLLLRCWQLPERRELSSSRYPKVLSAFQALAPFPTLT